MTCPAYRELIEEFENAHPGIKVRLHSIPNDTWNQPSIERNKGIAYEILSTADTTECLFSLEAVKSGWILDLAPLIEMDPTFKREDFYPNMLESFQWNKGIWGVPIAGTIPMLFYDRTAFDAAGLPYPVAGWDLEDFLDPAQHLTLFEADQIVRYGFEDMDGFGTILGQAMMVWSPGDPASLFGSEMRSFVEWYTDLYFKHSVMPIPWVFSDSRQTGRPFGEIRSAMWADVGANFDYYQAFVPNLGVAPLPEGWPALWRIAFPLAISAGTSHPQESWRWLNFVSHRRMLIPGQDPFSFEVPARRSLAAAGRFWESMEPLGNQQNSAYETRLQAYQYAVEHSSRGTMDLVGQRQLLEAMVAVFGGERIDQALEQARQIAVKEFLRLENVRTRPAPISVSTPERLTLIFVAGYPTQPNMFAQLTRSFEQEHPNIAVEIRSPGSGDQHGDCFAGFVDLDNLLDREKILPLDPLLDHEEASYLDDFYPSHLRALRREGKLWGLPLQTSMAAIYHNKDLFDQVDIPYPNANWTRADFEEVARALTFEREGINHYGYTPLGNVFWDWLLYLATQNILPWNAQGRPQFNDPAVVEATVQYFQFLRDVAPPLPEKENDLRPFRAQNYLVQESQVAMWHAFTLLEQNYPWANSIRYGIAPVPRGTAGMTWFEHTGLHISADTASPQACWQWLKHVSKNSVPSRALSSRRSVTESERFARRVGQESVAAFRVSVEYTSPYLPDDDLSLESLEDALVEIWRGVSPATALERAQNQVGK
jgi:ABC-type glycerol-3-phosphate transport system substrate-binding protein